MVWNNKAARVVSGVERNKEDKKVNEEENQRREGVLVPYVKINENLKKKIRMQNLRCTSHILKAQQPLQANACLIKWHKYGKCL